MATNEQDRKGAPESGGAREVGTEEARINLGELASRAAYGGERFIITRHGKPLAALISAADLAKLEGAAA